MANLPEVGVTATVKNVDGFMRDMGKLAQAVATTEAAVWKTGAKGVQVGQQALAGAQDVIRGVQAGVGLAQNVLGTVDQLLDATLGKAIEWNHLVLQISTSTGVTTEEVGRLLTVMQEFGLTLGQATAVMQDAAAKGFVPTIANIIALAEEARAIADPLEQAAFLEDRLGNSAAIMAPFLMQGEEAIRSQTDAVMGSLAPTEEAIAKTEAMRENVARLKSVIDTIVLAIGNWLANGLLPIIDGLWNVNDALKEQTDALVGAADSYAEFQASLADQDWMMQNLGRQMNETEFDNYKLMLSEQELDRATQGSTDTLLLQEEQLKASQAEYKKTQDAATKLANEEVRAAEQASRELERIREERERSMTDFFNRVVGGGGGQFDKLDDWVRQLDFGGEVQALLDEQLDQLIREGRLSKEDAQALAEAWIPTDVFTTVADELGWDMGDAIGSEMKDALLEGLKEQGVGDKEARAWVKTMAADPKEFIGTQQDVLVAMMRGMMAEGVTTGVTEGLDAAAAMLPEQQLAWDEFWQSPLRRAILLAEDLVKLGERSAAIVYGAGAGSVSPPHYATGTPHTSPGPVDNSSMNLTVNTSAPAEPIEADFRLLKAMKRSR